MMKAWVLWFEVQTGLDLPQLQAIAAMLGIVGAIALWIGKGWGWRSAWSEFRQFRKRLDDDHIVIERLVFENTADGQIVFDRETEGGIRPLKQMFGSDELVEKMRAAIRKNGSARVFPPGPLHRLMMERVDAFITGNDRSASQSAMFGRSGEYHTDHTAFIVRYMVGEDGFSMLHVLLINPEDLMRIQEAPGLRWLKARRQSYEKKYFTLLPELAKEYDFSARLFRTVQDEDEAGEQAAFWTALIRTSKQLAN